MSFLFRSQLYCFQYVAGVCVFLLPSNHFARQNLCRTHVLGSARQIQLTDRKKWEMDKIGYTHPFFRQVGGGKMQTSSPPVITPNRSQSNPDDMITLPQPIQSVGMDLHDVSGTSTGQTLPRERRAPPGTHFCPTIWWVYPHFATIFILHPLLSTFSSTFIRYIPTYPLLTTLRPSKGGLKRQ